MIVDTSALVALILGEPEAEAIEDLLVRDAHPKIAAPTYVELCAVIAQRRRPELDRGIERLLDAYAIEVVSFDARQAVLAADAYRDYGRGSGHLARLNLGDCYSYALAAMTGEPLLFIGDDFIHTDLTSALGDGSG